MFRGVAINNMRARRVATIYFFGFVPQLPCPAGDLREAQCTAFDARPFGGRSFRWRPFLDGENKIHSPLPPYPFSQAQWVDMEIDAFGNY
jgi:hypothetical protein